MHTTFAPCRTSTVSTVSALSAIVWITAVVGPAQAHPRDCPTPPASIALPPGFQPEGITTGGDDVLLIANFNDGSVLAAHASDGKRAPLVPAQAGRQALGLKIDARSNHLFVAGGGTGHAYVYDAHTGANVADYVLAAGPTFINDVIITEGAAYFTDSFRPVMYKIPLGRHGRLPDQSKVQAIPLTGDYLFVEFNPDGSRAFNANGIEADRGHLIIVNSVTGKLYAVDPDDGVATEISLGTGSVVNGDGLVLSGRTLYVVENFSNQVAVVHLSHRGNRGQIVDTLTSPLFDIPATAVLLDDALYVTNARFSTPHTESTPYQVTRVPVED
jgi:sugar lactone lactonase YvrE